MRKAGDKSAGLPPQRCVFLRIVGLCDRISRVSFQKELTCAPRAGTGAWTEVDKGICCVSARWGRRQDRRRRRPSNRGSLGAEPSPFPSRHPTSIAGLFELLLLGKAAMSRNHPEQHQHLRHKKLERPEARAQKPESEPVLRASADHRKTSPEPCQRPAYLGRIRVPIRRPGLPWAKNRRANISNSAHHRPGPLSDTWRIDCRGLLANHDSVSA